MMARSTKPVRPIGARAGSRVVAKRNATRPGEAFHLIYSLPSDAAREALDALGDAQCDAIVMLGTGMPTLRPIAETPRLRGVPVLSCMFCLVWACVTLLEGAEPSAASLDHWLAGSWWRASALARTQAR